MKSKMLLEKIMRMDNIVEAKIYHINENSYDLNTHQIGLNSYIKETINNNLKTDKANFLFI
ncbi:MAG: hypothetical protein WCG23_01085 [bacterium]